MASARSSLVSVLCCLLLATVAYASVEDICRKIVFVKHAMVKYDFCIRFLQSDPASATADERGIAVIVGNLGSRNAQSTLAKINSLLKTATNPMAGPLKDCRELYEETVGKLLAAAAAAKAGNYSHANSYFNSGIFAADTCADEFPHKNLRSPLITECSELHQICAIGDALTYNGA